MTRTATHEAHSTVSLPVLLYVLAVYQMCVCVCVCVCVCNDNCVSPKVTGSLSSLYCLFTYFFFCLFVTRGEALFFFFFYILALFFFFLWMCGRCVGLRYMYIYV